MPPTPVAAPWYGSMKLGWLWLSILNTTAWPSPMSMTPAFSPGPWITQGALVGSPRRWMREDLYEQCSFHIAEKIPSSVKLGTRPISLRMRSYSSGFSPWLATSSGVIWGSFMDLFLGRSGSCEKAFYGAFPPCPELCGDTGRDRRLHIAAGSDLRAEDPQLKARLRERAHQNRIPQASRHSRRNRGRIRRLA